MAGKVKSGAREAAFRVLNRVDSGAYADILLGAALEGLAEPDAALATEIVNGVLRWRMRLDYSIGLFSSMKTDKLERRVLNALRVGAYQLLFLTRVPASAAINESVNLIKGEGARKAGFVNAVLRRMEREKGGILFPGNNGPVGLSILYSHPEWLVRRWIERYGPVEAEALLKADNEIPPRVLRVNTLVATREALISGLEGEGFEARPTRCSPLGVEIVGGGGLRAKDNRYYIQDEASQLVPLLLSPSPGEAVLDACAAPGGKTTEMAELMNDRGSIDALDIHEGRLKSVTESAERLGISIIRTREADSALPLGFARPGYFDAALVDAPCTGLGVLRRSPEIRYRRTVADIAELSSRQAQILENVSGYVKKGGRVVYSTCTLEPEETEAVVTGFLSAHDDFVLEDAAVFLPGGCGVVDEKGFLRTFPHRHGMDGFFAARLKRL